MKPIEAGVIITQHFKKSITPDDAKEAIVETFTTAGYGSNEIINLILEAARKLGINDIKDVDDAIAQIWVEIRQVNGTFVWATALELVAKTFAEVFADGRLDVSDIWTVIRNVYQALFGNKN